MPAKISEPRNVTLNGAPPLEPGFSELERRLGKSVADGDYWYDAVCGVCGRWGGPAEGLLPPGLEIAVPLPEDASGGGSGMFINGREIHPQDVVMLNRILILAGAQCLPGRWTVDAAGNLSPEGGFPLLNLVELQANSAFTIAGDNLWSGRFSAGTSAWTSGYGRAATGTVSWDL